MLKLRAMSALNPVWKPENPKSREENSYKALKRAVYFFRFD